MWRGRFPSRSSFCWPPRSYDSVPLRAYGKNSRFHIPLIEPDMQISRIRLSDKTSRLRPRLVASAQTGKTEVPVKVREWIGSAFAMSELVLITQPPA